MRLISFLPCIGAGALAFAAHAQAPADQPAPVPSANAPLPDTQAPPPDAGSPPASVPPVQQVPSSLAQPGADGVVHQWGPEQPVVQAAPPPATSYPLCSRTVRDGCRNPDPRKEADVKRG